MREDRCIRSIRRATRLNMDRLATSKSLCPSSIIISRGKEVKKSKGTIDTKSDLISPSKVNDTKSDATAKTRKYVAIHNNAAVSGEKTANTP
jgi:hypothetical protein